MRVVAFEYAGFRAMAKAGPYAFGLVGIVRLEGKLVAYPAVDGRGCFDDLVGIAASESSDVAPNAHESKTICNA
jgi:hypothetical protein